MTEMLREMTGKGLGFTAVCDASGRVAGIFTDGDLRRLIETGADLRALRASDVMSASPKLVRDDALAVEAADLMERHRVTGLLVVDARRPAGRRDQLERPDAREGHLMGAADHARARVRARACCSRRAAPAPASARRSSTSTAS